jgi:hypothetical protein
MRSLSLVLLGAAAATLSSTTVARAASPPVPGTRALGMGGALRGAATGDSALTLNPSGMSLMRAYVVEGAYAYDHIGSGASNLGRVSIVDSTSGFNIAGGVYYNYLSDDASNPHRSGHEGGFALAAPFGEHLYVGGTVKYFRLTNENPPVGVPAHIRGFTFDAGLTLKPVGALTIGLAGQNLSNLHTDRAPRTFGGGVAVGASSSLIFALDTVVDFDSGPKKVWNVMGGGEYLMAKTLALRAGGGRRGLTQAGYLSAGVSVIAQVGAIDAGFQQDLGGNPKETFIGVSGRLFLPAPE